MCGWLITVIIQQVQGSDSDVSISSDFKSSKSNLKGRLSGMFKRAGSSSRANSSERILDTVDRPVSVTSVVSNGQSQLPPPTTPRMRRSVSLLIDLKISCDL